MWFLCLILDSLQQAQYALKNLSNQFTLPSHESRLQQVLDVVEFEPNVFNEAGSNHSVAPPAEIVHLQSENVEGSSNVASEEIQSLRDLIVNLTKEILEVKKDSVKDIQLMYKKIIDIHIDLKEVKALIIAKKKIEDQANVMTLDQFREKHKILETLDPKLDPKTMPIFSTFRIFEAFEGHESFMKNEEFKKDLGKYFYTTINIVEPYKEEMRSLLKIFFNGHWLQEKYVGMRSRGGKLIFSQTGFASVLIQSVLVLYRTEEAVQDEGKENIQKQLSERDIIKAIGDIITHAGDWGGRLRSVENRMDNQQ